MGERKKWVGATPHSSNEEAKEIDGSSQYASRGSLRPHLHTQEPHDQTLSSAAQAFYRFELVAWKKGTVFS